MSIFGQMNENTERWNLIQSVLNKYKIETIVEIGTWRGMGSTLCFLKNKNNNCKFISLESNFENYTIAKNNLSQFENDFKLIYGRIIEIEDVINFISDLSLTEEQKFWLKGDLSDLEKVDNVIEIIPDHIDFLLLDGGEFSTYPEWKMLKNKTKIVALDDIYVLKCNKIYLELINDPTYKILFRTDEGHGFCIFEKII